MDSSVHRFQNCPTMCERSKLHSDISPPPSTPQPTHSTATASQNSHPHLHFQPYHACDSVTSSTPAASHAAGSRTHDPDPQFPQHAPALPQHLQHLLIAPSPRGSIVLTHDLQPANTHRKPVSEVAPVGLVSANEQVSVCNTGHSRRDNVCSGSSISSRRCRWMDVSVSRSCAKMATNTSMYGPWVLQRPRRTENGPDQRGRWLTMLEGELGHA